MTDNFNQIRGLLTFDSEDDFYFCQIIKRKKENPDVGSNSVLIKSFYIKSVEQLDKLREEMIVLATLNNARVCINLNRRSFERLAYQMLKKVTDIIINKDFKSIKNAYDSVCGEFSNEKVDKKWIVDIDEKGRRANEVLRYIDRLEPVGSKLYAIIETKNGVHLITRPFNMAEFRRTYKDIDVHKNNPTIIYIP